MTHTAKLPRRVWHSAFAFIGCLSAVVVVVAGCETSSTITSGPDPLKCQLSLAAPPMIDAGGGTGTLAVTTSRECAWTATSSAPWISVSPSSGQGSANVELRATSNDGSAQRDGDVIVNDQQVRVSQRAPCRFEIAPAIHSIAAAGGSGRVTVSTLSECAWTATSDVTWIVLATPVSGSGNGAATFTVAVNGGNERTGNVVIAGQRSTVTQAALVVAPTPPPTPPPPSPSCNYTLSKGDEKTHWNEGFASVGVSTTSACAWTASSNSSWLSIQSGSGTGNGQVTYAIRENPGGLRIGSLTVAGHVFVVEQGARPGSQ